MDLDEWDTSGDADVPVALEAFPRAGTNSLASLWGRAFARLIDTLVVSVPTVLVTLTVALATVGLDPEEMENSTAVAVWAASTTFVVQFLYETICVTLWGQTFGKWCFGIRVARHGNGRCPLWWEAGIRVALPAMVAAIPHPIAKVAAIGLYVVAAFDPLRRTVPDRAAGTVVVRVR